MEGKDNGSLERVPQGHTERGARVSDAFRTHIPWQYISVDTGCFSVEADARRIELLAEVFKKPLSTHIVKGEGAEGNGAAGPLLSSSDSTMFPS